MEQNQRIETLAIHAGRKDEDSGAVAASIVTSTTYARHPDNSLTAGHIYSRFSNPNRQSLEECMAALEGGAAAAAFASGSAATMAVFQSLRPGDHVVVTEDPYYGTIRILDEVIAPWGLEVSRINTTDIAAVQGALKPNSRLVWIETPSNPLMRITDIAAVAAVCHQAGVRCVCDNTFATPILTRPLQMGADMVVHSASKYLGGHSDVMGGIVVTAQKDEFWERLHVIQTTGGGVLAPFESWLVMRGIKTLPLRVRAQSQSAVRIAHFLSKHPAVEKVHYPGLSDHPGYDIACRQMELPGAMLSAQLRGTSDIRGEERALRVVSRVKVFTRATSLGGVESFLEHRASVEGPSSTTPRNLLRISIGLEHHDDLIADLEQALEL